MKVSYVNSNDIATIDHEVDLGLEDTQNLLEEFVKNSKPENYLWIESSFCDLDFSLDKNNNLWVEVFSSRNGLWAISEIDLTIGKEMLKIAYAEKDLEEIIPTTNRNWDAYTPIFN